MGGLDGFQTASIEFDVTPLDVAVADSPDLRSQGLRGVSDLGGLDGMIFVFKEPAPVWFTMQDTLIPLDLVVVSAERRVVARIPMVPCVSEPCPLYPTEVAAAYTVELAAGSFPEITVGSTLSIKQGIAATDA